MNYKAWRGTLAIDGWAGRSEQPVIVEGETPKRYRIRAVGDALRLPSRGNGVRIILRSGTALVPKYVVRPEEPKPFTRDRDATCDWNCQLPNGHTGPCSPEEPKP